jgi:hypothetical protein
MFDIREYYQNSDFNQENISNDINNIDLDISSDLDTLLKSRFDNLYKRDRYKTDSHSVDIIYPRLTYPGNRSHILNADKIRFLLSFYPDRSDLNFVEKIVLRPRYIEVGNIELSSLYLSEKKILVLYLTQPYYYTITDLRDDMKDKFMSIDTERLFNFKQVIVTSGEGEKKEIRIFPIWYILSMIASYHKGKSQPSQGENIEKFFLKKTTLDNSIYHLLNDISFYYSRHGY